MDDAVIALERVIHLTRFAILNIAHPRVIETETLARMFCQWYGRKYNDLVREIPLPPQMTLEKIPDVRRQKELLGFEPQVSIDQGVSRVASRIIHDDPQAIKTPSRNDLKEFGLHKGVIA
jgi:nucleoside-diphosphate-sugar epimerase